MKMVLDGALLFVVIVCVSGDDFTLTTAVVRDETTPKPTAIYRRIRVDPHVEERISAPLDLFRLRSQEIRRTRSNIWNWDYWCQLQPKMGNCSQNIVRYYYDAQVDQCMSFTYTGCNGNKNYFETQIDCERYCKGATYSTIKNAMDPSFCALQPNTGICMALFYRYYFDVNDNDCKQFVYGGCGGNQNKFDTHEECMKVCRQDNT